MSWVRIESSTGLRVSAPSIAPPPVLEGFDKLFQPPLRLRQIHSFSTARSAWDGAGAEEEEPLEEVVLLSEVQLGGRVGDVCIAVGGPQMTEEALGVLQDCTVALLKGTSGKGLQTALDALCTRPPRRIDVAPKLLELDGLTGNTVPQKAPGNQALLSSAAYGLHTEQNRMCNRHFLNEIRGQKDPNTKASNTCESERMELMKQKRVQMLMSNENGGNTDASTSALVKNEPPSQRALQLMASSVDDTTRSSSALTSEASLRMINFLAKVLTRDIHYARRQALLYFLKLDTVPISLFSCRVRPEQEEAIFIPRTGEACDLSALAGQPVLKVNALLARSEKLQEKSKPKTLLWREMSLSAVELGQLLTLAVQRTLCCTFPFHADLFGKDMWGKTHRSTVHTPLFAAFSASGLLIGSGTYYYVLNHRDRFLLAGMAINALACSPLERPYQFATVDGARYPSAEQKNLDWAIQVTQLPLTISSTLAGTDTLDLCIFTIGDAVSVVVGVSRTVQQRRGLNMSTLAEALKQGIGATVKGGGATTAVPSRLGIPYFHALSYHVHTLCRHNLSPTQEFYTSVCALSVLENGLFFDKKPQELGVVPALLETLSQTGSDYYGDGIAFDDGDNEDQDYPVIDTSAGPNPTRVVREEDAGCVCCLPFCRKKKPDGIDQADFAASRARDGKHKLRKAKARYTGGKKSHQGAGGATSEMPARPREELFFLRQMLMLNLPLHAMWYFVGSRVAVTELLAFRSLEGTGVHSAFWLQRSLYHPLPQASTPSPLHGGASAESKAEAHRRSTNSQYSIAFFRPRVEQSRRMPHAEEEEEQHGVLHLQDPSLSVDYVVNWDHREVSHGKPQQSQVTVFPVGILEKPVSSPLHGAVLADGRTQHPSSSGRNLDNAVRSRLLDAVLQASETMGVSSAAMEDEEEDEGAVLTSIYLATEEKLHLKKHKRFGRAADQLQQTNRNAKGGGGGGAATSGMENTVTEAMHQDEVLHTGDVSGAVKSAAAVLADAAAAEKVTSLYTRVEEVVNVEEDLCGEEWNLLRAMEKRRLPKEFELRRDPDLFDAAKTPDHLRELCEELARCKEAAITLFNGVLIH